MAQHKNKGWQMRKRIAQIAAEYLSETGSQDYQLAKNKAANQLGLGNTDTTNLPSNKEIQQALIAYQRIFRADAQPLALQQHRQTALQAMQFFQQFNPRLVGSVLDGSADIQSDIYYIYSQILQRKLQYS